MMSAWKANLQVVLRAAVIRSMRFQHVLCRRIGPVDVAADSPHHRPMLRRFLAAWCVAFFLCGIGSADEPLKMAVGGVGIEADLAAENAAAFTEKTGIEVELVSVPNSPSERLALYQQWLADAEDGEAEVDVLLIDVVWPGVLGRYLLSLEDAVPVDARAEFFPAMIANNTVSGELKALPWFTDSGLLYYRKDLLEKYGFAEPPATWDQLELQAATIMQGERAAGKAQFTGFVWQGNAYEGMFCNVVEWVSSYGAAPIVSEDGTIAVNNPRTVAAFDRAAKWVGGISPEGVTTYGEEEARTMFQSGQAAFMRNWPYAYALAAADGSQVRGKVDIAPLPAEAGDAGRQAGCLGGWQLAVAKTTAQPDNAQALVVFLTSKEIQRERAMRGSLLPTRPALYKDKAVLAIRPFFEKMGPILERAVARPSTVTGTKYNRVATATFNAVHKMLTKKSTAEEAAAALQKEVETIRGESW